MALEKRQSQPTAWAEVGKAPPGQLPSPFFVSIVSDGLSIVSLGDTSTKQCFAPSVSAIRKVCTNRESKWQSRSYQLSYSWG